MNDDGLKGGLRETHVKHFQQWSALLAVLYIVTITTLQCLNHVTLAFVYCYFIYIYIGNVKWVCFVDYHQDIN